MKRVSMESLVKFGTDLLVKKGVPRARARYVATMAVETEAFRQSTHGIVLLDGLAKQLGKDVDPRRNPRVVAETAAGLLLDGQGCLASWAMKVARDKAVAKARRLGVATAAVRNTGWIAALGMHLVPAAREGFVVTAWAQSCRCLDCAPYGGIDPCFSTNPIAMAIPTGGDPVVADFSTATMSMGAAWNLVHAKKKTAEPRFLDRRGRPTRDPSVIGKGGSLMFLGCEIDGHKGYALSLLNEAMTVLAGGSANNPKVPQRQSFGVTVFNPARFGGTSYFLKEMKRFVKRVKGGRARPGFGGVRLPGERGFKALMECRTRGIPLGEEKLRMLKDLAHRHGVRFAP